MRLRIALIAALLCVTGVFILEMSGTAQRLAGTNHASDATSLRTPKRGTVCQSDILPGDAGRLKLLIAAEGHPLPAISAAFHRAGGGVVTSGKLPAGRAEGFVLLPLRHPHGPSTSGTLCLHIDGHRQITIGGQPTTPGPSSARLDGKAQPLNLTLVYIRGGPESWWQLLPTLAQRLGYGKAAFFGTWTLPFAAVLLLGVWIATIRLLFREAS